MSDGSFVFRIVTRDGHADVDIRINFRIIRQYRAISYICRIYPTYALMLIAKISACPSLIVTHKFVFVQIGKGICPNCKVYLSKLNKLFFQTGKCICPNWRRYLPKLKNVFVQIGKYFLSQLQSVFVQI